MKTSNRLSDLQLRMRSRGEPTPARGRPRVAITPAVVHKLASLGLQNNEIAMTIGCSVRTLQRRFSQELTLGRALISGSVKVELVRRAFHDGDPRALFLLAKSLKWDN